MKHKIEYTSFEFKPPKAFSEKEYILVKEILIRDQNYKFIPNHSFINQFKKYLYTYGFVIISIIIEVLFDVKWIEIISSIFGVIAFLSLFSFVPSVISYIEFINDKRKYYSNLKKLIQDSKDYSEYLSKYRFIKIFY